MPAYAVAHLRSVAMGSPIVEYLQRIDATLAPFGGRFLVHGSGPEVLEGSWPGHLIVIAFPDREQARAWYRSAAYQGILRLRTDNSEGDVILVDGVSAGHRATDILAHPNLQRRRDGRSRGALVTGTGGVDLFIRDWGAGAPILFLSGWALNSDMWAYQMMPLVLQGFRCVAYDRRGHGRSSDPGEGYDFDSLADDLAMVMETLDLSGVTLVGHSFSSGEMVRFLSRHGQGRIARLLFLAPASIPFLLKTADNPDGVDAPAFEQLRAAFLQSFPDWIEACAEPYFLPGTSRAIIDWTIRMMTQTSLQAAVELNRIQTSTDFRPGLSKITLPSLIIHGDRDASAPLELTGRPASALIPGARLEVYEGAPHGLYFTHKERLNRDLVTFAAG